MKNCPYCGQQNPEENQFCNKCGADMVNIPELETVYIDPPKHDAIQSILPRNEQFSQSVWD